VTRSLLALVLMVSAACAGGAARPSPAPTSAAPSASTASPQIDVTDMMGVFPPTTFFVVRPGREVAALALLNHATKYTIPIEGDAEVATATERGRLYILDQSQDGARLRWFDIANGTERASRILPGALPVPTGAGHGTLALDRSTDDLFALLRQGPTKAIEQFEGSTLRPVKRLLADLRCGERLVASGGRVAMACLGEGGLVVSDAAQSIKLSAKEPLVSLAIAPSGTVLAGTAEGRLFRLAPGARELETIEAIRERGARLIPDGIAAQADCCFILGLLERVANPQVRIITGGFTLLLFPEASPPSGGILFQAPFAYYTSGTQAGHIDTQQGFGEVMTSFPEAVLPGAVADR